MTRLARILALLAALGAPMPAHADQVLPPGRLTTGNDILFGAIKLGKRQSGKTIFTPDRLEIQDPGSTGDVSGMGVTPSGGTATRTLAEQTGRFLDPRALGALFNGSANDTAAINAAIAAQAAKGGGTVLLPPGTSIVGGIVMRSNVELRGSGQVASFLRCVSSPCITKVAAEQLSSAKITNFNIRPHTAAQNGATVLEFGTINQSKISDMLIEGFVDGTWLKLGGSLATNIVDTNLGSNVIWNRFSDITVYGCGVCSIIQGTQGATPYTDIANSANEPSQVVTANLFDNVNLYIIKTKGWSIFY